MPDVVQLPDDEAQGEKQQQPYGADLIPEPDLLGHQEEPAEHQGDHAAVDIGQTLFEVGLQGPAQVPRHLPHGIQQPLPVVGGGNVQPEAPGEGVDAGLGGLQRRQGRQLQNGRHADGQQGEEGDPQQVLACPLQPREPADLIAEKDQGHKDAHKKAHIIVGIHPKEQGDGVQEEPLLLEQPDLPQDHQGQQGKGIQPHDVPLEAQGPGAQGVKGPEYHGGEVLFPVELFQQQEEKQPRQSQLDGHQQRKIAQQPLFRHQNAEKVQGACQIVGDEPQIIQAHANAPVVQQTLPGPQGPAKGHKEGVILMVHIGIQHGGLAERLVAADEHHQQHPHKGEQKGQRRKIPFGFLDFRQTHENILRE